MYLWPDPLTSLPEIFSFYFSLFLFVYFWDTNCNLKRRVHSALKGYYHFGGTILNPPKEKRRGKRSIKSTTLHHNYNVGGKCLASTAPNLYCITIHTSHVVTHSTRDSVQRTCIGTQVSLTFAGQRKHTVSSFHESEDAPLWGSLGYSAGA